MIISLETGDGYSHSRLGIPVRETWKTAESRVYAIQPLTEKKQQDKTGDQFMMEGETALPSKGKPKLDCYQSLMPSV